MKHSEKALNLFMSGYNCSQSVFAAFCDVIRLDEPTALKISLGLGGGIGRMREVCGTISAGSMILGAVYGGEGSTDKKTAYEKTREFAEKFREIHGSVICRELLMLTVKMEPSANPDERNAEYYAKRPCARLVVDACEILDAILAEKSQPKKVDKIL